MDQDQRRVACSLSGRCARLRSDKRGATVIEYGLIVSLIVVAIMGALSRSAAAPAGASSIVSFELDVAA